MFSILKLSKKMKTGMLFTDFCRAFFSLKFILALIGTISVLFVTLIDNISCRSDVVSVFFLVEFSNFSLMILITSAYAYADAICEDIEHKYISQIVVRNNRVNYVFSKVITIFLSAFVCTVIAYVVYSYLLRLRMPWFTSDSTSEFLLQTKMYDSLIKRRLYPLYFMALGIRKGMLAGVFAVFASYFSLYVKSKTFVLATPFFGYYFLDSILSSLLRYPLLKMAYSGNEMMFSSEVVSLFAAFVLTVLALIILFWLINKKIKTEYFT